MFKEIWGSIRGMVRTKEAEVMGKKSKGVVAVVKKAKKIKVGVVAPVEVSSSGFKAAYKLALTRCWREENRMASEVSVGFVTDVTGAEYQVSVKVCRFSAKLLKKQPLSGGLLVNKK